MHWNDENMCLDTQIQYISCIEKPTKKNNHLKNVLELHIYQKLQSMHSTKDSAILSHAKSHGNR
jgi:hypothetical protein